MLIKQEVPVINLLSYIDKMYRNMICPMDHPYITSAKGLDGFRKRPFFLSFSTVLMLTYGWVCRSRKVQNVLT